MRKPWRGLFSLVPLLFFRRLVAIFDIHSDCTSLLKFHAALMFFGYCKPNTLRASLATSSPHSGTKCPASAISRNGGQLRIVFRRSSITDGPSTVSFIPTAINACPCHREFNQER